MVVTKKLYLTDIQRTLYPETVSHTFFLSSHGTFLSLDHIRGQKTSLSIFKRLKWYNMFFDENSDNLHIHKSEKV